MYRVLQVVTAETAFLCLSMFNILRLSITLFFPLAISQLGEMVTSIKRIQVDEAEQELSHCFAGFPLVGGEGGRERRGKEKRGWWGCGAQGGDRQVGRWGGPGHLGENQSSGQIASCHPP